MRVAQTQQKSTESHLPKDCAQGARCLAPACAALRREPERRAEADFIEALRVEMKQTEALKRGAIAFAVHAKGSAVELSEACTAFLAAHQELERKLRAYRMLVMTGEAEAEGLNDPAPDGQGELPITEKRPARKPRAVPPPPAAAATPAPQKSGEPEPQTCANGYHLYQSGTCARCAKPEGMSEEQWKRAQGGAGAGAVS